MAGLRELKNRLSSINTVGQLAGAMRTVSAAKYSRVSSVRGRFAPYAQSCQSLIDVFGGALTQALPCGDPEAPACYVVISGNRGLCGGYNTEIQSYGAEILRSAPEPWRLITVGKTAQRYFADAGFPIERAFEIPDVPEFEQIKPVLEELRDGYTNGKYSAVYLIYQKFINMLSRETTKKQLLPLPAGAGTESEEALLLPDRPTVLHRAACSCVDAILHASVLEAAAGAQAATLVAMRSAYDNAQESILKLETQISRRRQSEVTEGVLETASDNGE